jgi:type I restriction enzyme M protein
MENIEQIESDLWEAADQLRANSKLTSTEYCIPLLGIIFLRHAANRFDGATRQIEEDQKNGTTIKLARMNLAVHGLEGNIIEANTFYDDFHTLYAKCDFVMANPPFNVDMVDGERIKDDQRLPFGLPGINKNKRVSNGNYLWISYFYSYLNEKGRAGFVMSSQASAAGRGEMEVRRKIVETGHVDVMIAIRSNFFYTRSVPCELWFFDKGKPENLQEKVLMIDARNIYRKVTRKIYDFTPEQLKNITAMVWLYRGETGKFLNLVKEYLETVCAECALIPDQLDAFGQSVDGLKVHFKAFERVCAANEDADETIIEKYRRNLKELESAHTGYTKEQRVLQKAVTSWAGENCAPVPEESGGQKEAREAFEPVAEKIKGLTK